MRERAWEGRLVRRRANRVSDSWQRGQRERKNDTNRTFSGLSGYVFILQNVRLFLFIFFSTYFTYYQFLLIIFISSHVSLRFPLLLWLLTVDGRVDQYVFHSDEISVSRLRSSAWPILFAYEPCVCTRVTEIISV